MVLKRARPRNKRSVNSRNFIDAMNNLANNCPFIESLDFISHDQICHFPIVLESIYKYHDMIDSIADLRNLKRLSLDLTNLPEDLMKNMDEKEVMREFTFEPFKCMDKLIHLTLVITADYVFRPTILMDIHQYLPNLKYLNLDFVFEFCRQDIDKFVEILCKIKTLEDV